MSWLNDMASHLQSNPESSDQELFDKFPGLNHKPEMLDAALSYNHAKAQGDPNAETLHPELFGGGGPSAPSRPDYSSEASRLAYLKSLVPKYGPWLHNRGDDILHVNDIPYGGTKSAHDSAVSSAQKVGLDPAVLYASAAEEGMSGLWPDKDGSINTDPDIDLNGKYPISGFTNYGLDNFHDQFKEMVRKGYLPKDFDYEKAVHTNEQGAKVNSANFKTPEDAMEAKAAYVRLEQDRLDDWLKTQKITLSPKARQFFTLVSFNGGDGTMKKMVKEYAQKNLLDGDKFLSVVPDHGKEAYNHVLPRMQMADLLRKEQYF